jgi:hypothetical protein
MCVSRSSASIAHPRKPNHQSGERQRAFIFGVYGLLALVLGDVAFAGTKPYS